MIGKSGKNINPNRVCTAEIFCVRLARGTLPLRAACLVSGKKG